MQLAIFTAIASTLPDKGPRRRVHRLRRGTKKLPCLSLQDSNELIRSNVAFVFGSFLVSEFTFGRFCSQLFDTVLQCRIRAKVQHCVCLVEQNNLKNGTNPPLECYRFRCRCHVLTLSQVNASFKLGVNLLARTPCLCSCP